MKLTTCFLWFQKSWIIIYHLNGNNNHHFIVTCAEMKLCFCRQSYNHMVSSIEATFSLCLKTSEKIAILQVRAHLNFLFCQPKLSSLWLFQDFSNFLVWQPLFFCQRFVINLCKVFSFTLSTERDIKRNLPLANYVSSPLTQGFI